MSVLTVWINTGDEVLQRDWDCLTRSKFTVNTAFLITSWMELTGVPSVCAIKLWPVGQIWPCGVCSY